MSSSERDAIIYDALNGASASCEGDCRFAFKRVLVELFEAVSRIRSATLKNTWMDDNSYKDEIDSHERRQGSDGRVILKTSKPHNPHYATGNPHNRRASICRRVDGLYGRSDNGPYKHMREILDAVDNNVYVWDG